MKDATFLHALHDSRAVSDATPPRNCIALGNYAREVTHRSCTQAYRHSTTGVARTVMERGSHTGEMPTRPSVFGVSEIKHARVRRLVDLLISARSPGVGITQAEIAKDSECQLSASTISRLATLKDLRLFADGFPWSEKHERLLSYLEGRLEAATLPASEDWAALPELGLEPSPLFKGVCKGLKIREERLRFIRADFPGDYLVAAFSSSWQRSFTISVMRIGVVSGGEIVATEIQKNRDTGNVEIYRGAVYGKSNTAGIIAFEEQQGFVRHYVQQERSPRSGKLRWMKGYLITTTGDQNGFFSPFYMEQLGPRENFRFSEQGQVESGRNQSAAHFAVDHLTYVATIDEIAKSHRKLAKSGPEKDGVRDSADSAAAYLRAFMRHAESHFLDAEQQVQHSFNRLRVHSGVTPSLIDSFDETE